jgi:zinc transport system substrate-binding protein
MKKIILYTILMLSILLISCTTTTVAPTQENEEIIQETINVAATFYPYYDLTRSIVGEVGEVNSVVPPTTEPHSFSPSTRDIANLQTIDAYVKTGVEFEAFEDTLLDAVPSSVLIIDASHGIELLKGGDDDHDEHEDEEEHSNEEKHLDEDDHDDENETHEEDDEHANEEEHSDEEEHLDEDDHDHSGEDPHVWLNPKHAITIVSNIESSLIETFPQHQEELMANAQTLKAELMALDEEYSQGLATCAKDSVLVTHNAYSYLAAEYGFEVHSISGLSPESEPTPAQLAQLVDEAQELGIKYVFFEELVNPDVAGVIADEVGAQTLTINPVAGSDANLGYVEIMRNNLNQLIIGLECQ